MRNNGRAKRLRVFAFFAPFREKHSAALKEEFLRKGAKAQSLRFLC
jgi:hypothetical protein